MSSKRGNPRSEDELAKLRKAAYETLKERGDIERGFERNFTCDECEAACRCRWVYDLYNTEGDCLALK